MKIQILTLRFNSRIYKELNLNIKNAISTLEVIVTPTTGHD